MLLLEVLASLGLCQRGVRAWAASPGRVIPSMAGGPVLWQLLPFEVLRSYRVTEHGEKASLPVKIGAGAGSALVTGKIEGGLLSGASPFGDRVGYQTPEL